jgi:hypothetical protein
MAKASARPAEQARSSKISARPRLRDQHSPERPVPEPAGAQDPIHSAIETIFRNDQSVREAMSDNLRERSTEALSVTNRAENAFSGFSASRYSPAERARPNYLAPGDDLAASLQVVLTKGADAIRKSTVPTSIRFRPTEVLRSMIKDAKGKDKSLVGTIDLGPLVDHIAPNSMVRPSRPRDPAFTACMAELEAEKRLKAIKGSAKEAATDGGPDATRGRGGTSPAAAGAAALTSTTTDTLVPDRVDLLMDTITSPESQLRYAVPSRSDQSSLQDAIKTFELRSGPSDVTSYHDFSSLQIAFEHVWTEIFDGKLTSLGKELYAECVKLKAFAGIDDGADPSIDTIDDLRQLMDEIRNLGKITPVLTPGEFRPSGGSGSGTTDAGATAIDVVKHVLDPASAITDYIGDKTVGALLDPAGALIGALGALFAGKPQLNWSSFPGPLPVSGDIISTRFDSSAVAPGTVEIALRNSPQAWWWKGIEFRELDAAGKIISDLRISNNPQDTDVSDRNSYNVLRLHITQLTNGVLEFKKAGVAGVPTGYYLLAGLGDGLKDRMRVTFTWEKD